MIYIHVPFCKSFCTYCDFYSEVKESFDDYADALVAEICDRKDEIAENISSAPEADTLYIGGGTPSVLPLSVLSRIVKTLRPAGEPWKEFTVEVNPEDIITKGCAYVEGLLELEVSRISMGVQSFDDGILRWMNRRHDSAGAVRAFEILRSADAAWRLSHPDAKPLQVSVDLIFGISHLGDDVWEDTISKTLSSGGGLLCRPDHISAYQLSIEEDSALARMVSSGKYEEASEDTYRRQYDILCHRLGEAGYVHYEISNFALPGCEALHNSRYWDRTPYVGLGPGAHSFRVLPDGRQVRSWNEQKLPGRLCNGSLNGYSRKEEILSQEDIRVEEIMLGLRTSRGIKAEKLCSLVDNAIIDRFLRDGGMELDKDRLRIPENRFFTSDEIIRELV